MSPRFSQIAGSQGQTPHLTFNLSPFKGSVHMLSHLESHGPAEQTVPVEFPWQLFPDCFHTFPGLCLTRTEGSVQMVPGKAGAGPMSWTTDTHSQFSEAFSYIPGGKHKARRLNPALHLVLSGPAPARWQRRAPCPSLRSSYIYTILKLH